MNARYVAMVVLAAVLSATAGAALGQRDTAPPNPKYRIPGSAEEPDRTQRRAQLNERTYDILVSIYEDFGADNFARALERTQELRQRRLNDYENALVLNLLGTLNAVTERYDEAMRYFKQVAEVDALGHSETQRLFANMAQLHIIEEQWDDAIRMYTRYFYWEDNPSPDSLYLMGVAHFQKQDFRGALTWLERAINDASRANETWYNMLLATHWQLKDMESAADVQARIISLWPEKVRYWEQLSSILRELGREDEALAVLSMAYQRGLLEDETKIVNLARYYIYREAPYNAARILRKGMDEGVVESNLENWRLLAQAYELARESDDAIEALQRVAAMSPDGETYIRVAQLHYAADDWEGVIRATRNALDKGGLRRPGRAWMMIGMAAYENEEYQEALQAFRRARDQGDERERANQWIRYINNELQAKRQLREGF